MYFKTSFDLWKLFVWPANKFQFQLTLSFCLWDHSFFYSQTPPPPLPCWWKIFWQGRREGQNFLKSQPIDKIFWGVCGISWKFPKVTKTQGHNNFWYFPRVNIGKIVNSSTVTRLLYLFIETNCVRTVFFLSGLGSNDLINKRVWVLNGRNGMTLHGWSFANINLFCLK